MLRCALVCLALTVGLVAQSAPLADKEQTGQQPTVAPTLPPPAEFPADKVPQDAVIVTIEGLCDHPAGIKNPANCKTTLTRAEFEKIVDALKPHAPQGARRMMALTYSQSLIKEQKADEMGLEKSPDFVNRLEVNRLLISHEALDDAQDKQEWDKVSDKEIEDYYRNNPSQFIAVDAERVFIPWFEPDENKTLPAAEKEKRDLEWKRKLKEEADKLHDRALAGEDFLVLQKEAYKFTDVGSDVTRQVITLPRTRAFMLDSALMPMMDLQTGQVSRVLPEDNGFYIFKATGRVSLPFDERTKREIRGKFRDERVAKDKADLKKLAETSATYDETYFGPPPQQRPAADEPPPYDVMPEWKQQ
jgi:hypothetical protein